MTVENPVAFGRPLRALDAPGFRLRETLYAPDLEIPTRPHPWAGLCLVVNGGYEEQWGPSRIRAGPASLVFHPPEQTYGDRVSGAGSRCFTIAIAPAVFTTAAEAVPALSQLNTARSGPPSWIAFQIRAELEMGDDLSPASVESAVLALLADLGDRPALNAVGAAPSWLERVRERIHDEFARTLTLEALAQTAGVHRVHLAREFRRHYGCAVGEYIRQRRVELASHRLIASGDRLSDIAFDAGFSDQSHLTNTFRRLVGLTPGVFRARYSPHRARPRR